MIAGGMDDILRFSLMPGMSVQELAEQIASGMEKAVEEEQSVDPEVEVKFLVLVDLYGGTPCTTVLSLMRNFDIDVVTGLNLPMLIEVYFLSQASTDPQLDFADLAYQTMCQSGRVIRSSDLVKKEG